MTRRARRSRRPLIGVVAMLALGPVAGLGVSACGSSDEAPATGSGTASTSQSGSASGSTSTSTTTSSTSTPAGATTSATGAVVTSTTTATTSAAPSGGGSSGGAGLGGGSSTSQSTTAATSRAPTTATHTTSTCGPDCQNGSPTVPGSVAPVNGKCGSGYTYLPPQDNGPALCIPDQPASTSTTAAN